MSDMGKCALLERWKQIEELDVLEGDSAIDDDNFKQSKEDWFADAFAFLHRSPETQHCWCANKDIMLPLLEPFYNLPADTSPRSALRLLWQRVSTELGRCTRCVIQHHKAKEFYGSEYVEDVVGPLLAILQALDEERVASHLNDLLKRVQMKTFNSDTDSAEVICVLFEVLMFPSLLEDAEVNEAFRPFLQYVEATHDLSLSGGQRYPGVYTLLLHADQSVRRIATGLVKLLDNFKNAQDLEPIQPLLQKVMHCLEYDQFDCAKPKAPLAAVGLKQDSLTVLLSSGGGKGGRQRVGLTREGIWLGLPTILGCLESPALEEGLLERYPVFLSVVLNHVSEATSVFWNALRCLQLLLEILGYKLWLRTTFSAGVVRNTLISQCFHSNQERMHNSIFEQFQPFLQSLEALQDGEYERQRRRLLYFLLQQVPGSKNFSSLMSKKARQIAFSIIGRGYTMDPPLPPLDCAHVWGPPLVSTLKDISLHQSLRQPAIELFRSILVADASALAALFGKSGGQRSAWTHLLETSQDDYDETDCETDLVGDAKDWVSFQKVSDAVGENSENWSCVPLLWMEVLEGGVPHQYPPSFCKAVLWAVAQLAVVDLPAGFDRFGDAAALQWAKPQGYDDKKDADACVNAVPAEPHYLKLVGTFKKCADGYLVQLRNSKWVDMWSWEPGFAEPILLLLLDSNSMWKQFSRDVLCNFANDTSLEHGLELLCSNHVSIKAVRRAVLHASKMLLTWPIQKCSHGLTQLFFLGCKLLTLGQHASEGITSSQASPPQKSEDGGFLRQPVLSQQSSASQEEDNAARLIHRKLDWAYQKLRDQVSCTLWPLVVKAIMESKQLIEDKQQGSTFIRMLQLLPVVCKHVTPSLRRQLFGVSNHPHSALSQTAAGLRWFDDLIHLGSIAPRAVYRWWKEAIFTITGDLVGSGFCFPPELNDVLGRLLHPGSALNDEERMQLAPILKSLSGVNIGHGILDNLPIQIQQKDPLSSVEMDDDVVELQMPKPEIINLDSDNDEHGTLHGSMSKLGLQGSEVKALQMSDHVHATYETPDDAHTQDLFGTRFQRGRDVNSLVTEISGHSVSPVELQDNGNKEDHEEDQELEEEDGVPLASLFSKPKPAQKPHVPAPHHSYASGPSKVTTLDRFLQTKARSTTQRPGAGSHAKGERRQRVPSGRSGWKPQQLPTASGTKTGSKLNSLRAEHPVDLEQRAAAEPIVRSQVRERVLKESLGIPNHTTEKEGQKIQIVMPGKDIPERRSPVLISETDPILQELVMDVDADPLARALDSARRPVSLKDGNVPQRRQIITLGISGEQVRVGGSVRVLPRAPPPRLDEWFRRILIMDFFAATGVSDYCPESDLSDPLVKVPLRFESSQKYIEVFQPLLLEEFQAQLQRSYGELSLSDGMTTGTMRLMSLERVDDFQLGRFMAEGGADGAARACLENDLLLLTRQPLCLGEPQSCHMLAKVDCREREHKSRATILLLKLYLPTSNARLVKAKRLLVDRSKWHISRIMSLTPQLREFQALSAVGNLPLLPTILCTEARENDSTGGSFAFGKLQGGGHPSGLQCLPAALQSRLRLDFNESQVSAIAAVIGKRGRAALEHQLALVQGPPGTGKTRTIVAIVSSLLTGGQQSTNPSGKENQSRLNKSISTFPRQPRMKESAAMTRAWQDAALAREIGVTGNKGVGGSTDVQWGGPHKHRVLVCAQSNAAVDELVSRMCKNGLYGPDGNFFRPNLVRVGNIKTVHPESLPVFIDTLVEERLGAEKQGEADALEEKTQKQSAMLRTKLEEVIENIQVLEALHSQRRRGEKGEESDGQAEDNTTTTKEMGSLDPISQSEVLKRAARIIKEGETAVQAKLNSLFRQRRELSNELASAEREQKKLFEAGRTKRQAIRKAIIREADVVVTTLSGCGGDIYAICMETFRENKKSQGASDDGFFSAVVIDEAGQALEPATLIPLQLLAHTYARCVMVGDPKQLPATVISQVASKMAYECSMFERLQRSGYPVTMLSTQYRMHPEIRQFPSAYFYENRLADGLAEGSRVASFHKDWCFGPYVFFDVVDGYQRTKGTSASQSLFNEAEAEAALSIYKALQHRYPMQARKWGFGVITPYKQQLGLLRERFIRSLGSGATSGIEFNTVDGFQGREVDILILSTVRAPTGQDVRWNKEGTGKGIGFVADVRRMNVALTRARFSLWIVGNAATLEGSGPWAALLANARERQLVFSIKRPYALQDTPAADTHQRSSSHRVSTPHSRLIADTVDTHQGQRSFDMAKVSNEGRWPENQDREVNDYLGSSHERANRDEEMARGGYGKIDSEKNKGAGYGATGQSPRDSGSGRPHRHDQNSSVVAFQQHMVKESDQEEGCMMGTETEKQPKEDELRKEKSEANDKVERGNGSKHVEGEIGGGKELRESCREVCSRSAGQRPEGTSTLLSIKMNPSELNSDTEPTQTPRDVGSSDNHIRVTGRLTAGEGGPKSGKSIGPLRNLPDHAATRKRQREEAAEILGSGFLNTSERNDNLTGRKQQRQTMQKPGIGKPESFKAGLRASQGRTDIVNNTSLHQTRESNIKLQDQALVTRLSHPHARNSGDVSQRPSVADPRNRNSQLSSRESLESQWDLFEMYLKIGKVQDPDPAVQQSALKPPPSKSQKGPQIAGAPANSKPSFVDDILSGLGSLSRAQVKGSKELPLNASKRSRPS